MEPTRANPSASLRTRARGSLGGILSGQKLIRAINGAVFGRECIKVDSKFEVHLFLNLPANALVAGPPQKLKFLGLTIHAGSANEI